MYVVLGAGGPASQLLVCMYVCTHIARMLYIYSVQKSRGGHVMCVRAGGSIYD